MILHGENLLISVDDSVIAASKSCEINVDCEIIEVCSSTDGEWRHCTPGRKSWSVRTNHLIIDRYSNFLLETGSECTLRIEYGPVAGVFYNFVSNVNIETSGKVFTLPPTVSYDNTTHQFLAYDQLARKYYNSWVDDYDTYNKLHTKDNYVKCDSNDQFYILTNETGGMSLLPTLGGDAIYKGSTIVATKGSLIQGSYSFQGSGPLGT